MKNVELNDFIIEILQDFCETESMIKIIKEAIYNKNSTIELDDIGNSLEIIISKISNIKYSLNKYIDIAF